MKKLRKVYIFLVLALCLSLFSCQGGDGGGSGADGAQGGSSVDTAGHNYTLVYADDVPADAVNELALQLKSAFSADVSAMHFGSAGIPAENAIFIGECDTDASRAANRRMLRLDSEDDDLDKRYCVYADGSNVYLAFEQDDYGVNAAFLTAVEAMLENCFNDKGIKAGYGVVSRGVVNIIEYQRAIDTVKREAQFANLYRVILTKVDNDVALADDVYEQIVNLYDLYDSRMVSWMANLYDPDTGGFYFSNSARDTLGYLPDIETTRQMQVMITAAGLCTNEELPQWFKDGMIRFVKGLQHPNGYFYHPQWGVEMTDNNIQRRSRDVGFACALLQSLGASPTFDTPTGIKGDGILADGTPVARGVSGVAYRLGIDVESAVSAAIAKNGNKSTVIAVASFSFNSAVDLQSAENFESWLNTLDINSSAYQSYYMGNSFCTICNEIIERDRQLVSQGKRGLIDIVERWLASKQNPETGCWSFAPLDIDATNGLFKWASFYNGIGRAIPHPIEGINTTMKMLEILTPENAGAVVGVFNIWNNIDLIRTNVQNYGTNSQKAIVNEFCKGLLKSSSRCLENSIKVLAGYKRDDGSMSYNVKGNCITSQGMPVAVPGACEGDVNGCELGSVGTVPGLMQILGLPVISLFTRADGINFLSTLERLGSIVKKEPLVYEHDDLENEELGEGADIVASSSKASTGEGISIVDLEDGHGKVLKYASNGDGFDNMIIKTMGDAYSATCYVLEF
ncbi:MAG: hypothetical protein E7667_07125, partial [Ruminococcaceae bacterium]|nr:hypothetical protein [Oscillospiraceae bacterium]